MFADKQDRVEVVYLVMDERVFSDTILRVIRIGPWRYVAYDLPHFNGTSLFDKLSYLQRREKLAEILETFHFPDLIAIETPDEVQLWDTPVRGYEHYDEAPGTLGVFCPVKE